MRQGMLGVFATISRLNNREQVLQQLVISILQKDITPYMMYWKHTERETIIPILTIQIECAVPPLI